MHREVNRGDGILFLQKMRKRFVTCNIFKLSSINFLICSNCATVNQRLRAENGSTYIVSACEDKVQNQSIGPLANVGVVLSELRDELSLFGKDVVLI